DKPILTPPRGFDGILATASAQPPCSIMSPHKKRVQGK
ncbi:hypothetical protein AK812_SmicGene48244, partial [Symbiodinium microadriaticum]